VIDFDGASDVSAVDVTTPLSPGIIPVGLAVGPQLNDGSYLLLTGMDNDYSVTQNGSNTQFDVSFNPSTGERLQCDLGATTNCYAIATNGDTLTTNLGDLPPG
jgi:hypothetical protein